MIARKPKAAVYARYSTDKQRKEALDDQYRECKKIADREGLTVTVRFEDPEISGGTAQRRGYQAMLAAARRREFDIIIAEDISRLWRNKAEFGPRSAELEDLGVHLLTAVGDDTRRDGWGLLIQIKLAMAEQQRREAAYRTRRGLEGVAEAKRFVGGRPYGYRANPKGSDEHKGELRIDKEQAKWVKQIFEWYAQGQSALWIAHRLNLLKVPSPGSSWDRKIRRNKAWLASAISGDQSRGTGILNNEKYIGRMVWRRTRWIRSSQDSKNVRVEKSRPEDIMSWNDDTLRIIPQALWDRVKARQKFQSETLGAPIRRRILELKAERNRQAGNAPATPNARYGAGSSGTHLISGLLKCGTCSANLVMDSSHSYKCSTYRYGGPAACTNNVRVPLDKGTARILEAVKTQLAPRIADLKKEVIRQWSQRRRGNPTEIAAIRDEIADAQSKIANFVAAIGAGRGKPAAVMQALAEHEARLADLQSRLAALQASQGKVADLIPDLDRRVRIAVDQLEAQAKGRCREDIARARTTLRHFYGGQLRIEIEGEGKKRIPVAVADVPGFAILRAAIPAYRATENYGSGGRI
jgi:site-specific DNA recombinase